MKALTQALLAVATAGLAMLSPYAAGAPADFDGGGRSDVLWRNPSTGENYAYLMNGVSIAGEGYLRTIADQNWQVAGIGDFNGDGKADILWRNRSTGENYVYLLDGLSIAGEGYLRTVADQNWQVAGVGDFDGDGKADILWRNRVTGENYLYPMNGLAIQPGEGYLGTVADTNWQVAGIGDFDGDGKAGVFWRNAASGETYIYEMNGTALVAEGYSRTVSDLAWQIVATGDYDGDGKSDILWRNASTGENYLYPMDGTTIKATEGYIRTVADLTWWPTPAAGVFPVRIATGKRYLVDASGRPFLLHADTAWSLIAEVSLADAELYLEDRRSKGFNAILVNLIEHYFATNAPRNYYGEAPFTPVGDYSQPNEAYFARVDQIIRLAAKRDMLVLLVPSYLGYGGGNEGWYQEMVANGASRMRNYGRFLGQRYGGYSNILWVHGGDFNATNKNLVRQIALGIKEYDSNSLHTVHCQSETSALEYWSGESWLQVNNTYTRFDMRAKSEAAYADPMPFFFFEGRYENESMPEGNEQHMRVQAYQSLLSGAMGHIFGNNPIWHFTHPGLYEVVPANWKQWLNSPGAQSMVHVKSLLSSRPWWKLVPDFANTVLTAGHDVSGEPADMAVAAKASDGSFALAYLPSARPITVNLNGLAGPRVKAYWYDPASGKPVATPIPGSPFPSSGSRTLLPPAGNNASTTGPYRDWVLVLESNTDTVAP